MVTASGLNSTALGDNSTASGGGSTALGTSATASAIGSTALGNNITASGLFSTALGTSLIASGDYSMAAGYKAKATNDGAFVWADSQNLLFSSVTTNEFAVRANGGVRLVTGGAGLMVDGQKVPAGIVPLSQLPSVLLTNSSTGPNAMAAGHGATASGNASVSLGYNSSASGDYSTTLGVSTTAVGDRSTALGYNSKATNDFSTALGSQAIAGGTNSTAVGSSVIARGDNDIALGYQAVASGPNATALGYLASAVGKNAVALGNNATATNDYAIAMGSLAVASGFAAIALGSGTASGMGAVSLGDGTISSGFDSTTMGYFSQATNDGCFVWSDQSVIYSGATSTNNNSVTMRASGGYRLFSNSGMTAGVRLAPNSTSWAVISDRNAKKDFAAVDSPGILEKLAVMPVTQWRYKWEDETVTPHIGPMAQDFKAAFYPGTDDTSITTLEADGVAFAAIQGLNQKLEARSQELEDRSKQLAAENAELKQSVAELKKLVQSIVDKK